MMMMAATFSVFQPLAAEGRVRFDLSRRAEEEAKRFGSRSGRRVGLAQSGSACKKGLTD